MVANGTAIVGNGLHNITGYSNTCCGTQKFDYSTEVCCDRDKKIPKPPGAEVNAWLTCCGDEVVANPTTQICIDGKIRSRKGPFYGACGKRQYDFRRQLCCDDRLHRTNVNLGCCSTTKVPQAYDTRTHLCCSDGLVTLTREDRSKGNDACCTPYYPIPILTKA